MFRWLKRPGAGDSSFLGHYKITRKLGVGGMGVVYAALDERLRRSVAIRIRGLLPVCSSCKKVRDDKGYWNQVEIYLREHAAVGVSHALCPKCARRASEGPA